MSRAEQLEDLARSLDRSYRMYVCILNVPVLSSVNMYLAGRRFQRFLATEASSSGAGPENPIPNHWMISHTVLGNEYQAASLA